MSLQLFEGARCGGLFGVTAVAAFAFGGDAQHSTRQRARKAWACAAPVTALISYTGSGLCRACSHSCSAVLGSRESAWRGSVRSAGHRTAGHRLPCGTIAGIDEIAPISASSASARIDGRVRPPVFTSPSPSLSAAAEIEFASHVGQRALLDQIGTQTRQHAFGQFGKALAQQVGCDAVEHRVAEKLEALVVGRGKAAVGQRLAEQRTR
jgi:hypothetical protein